MIAGEDNVILHPRQACGTVVCPMDWGYESYAVPGNRWTAGGQVALHRFLCGCCASKKKVIDMLKSAKWERALHWTGLWPGVLVMPPRNTLPGPQEAVCCNEGVMCGAVQFSGGSRSIGMWGASEPVKRNRQRCRI